MKDLADRALQVAAVMVLFALALRWTWSILKPLAPLLVALMAGWGVLRYLNRRRDRW